MRSRCVMAYGSSKTRTAVSKRTSCLRRFGRFLVSSHSKRMAGSQQKHYTQLDCRCQYICTYNMRQAFCGRLRYVAPDAIADSGRDGHRKESLRSQGHLLQQDAKIELESCMAPRPDHYGSGRNEVDGFGPWTIRAGILMTPCILRCGT